MTNGRSERDSTRIVLDPPTFSPTQEMREGYLEKRKGELDTLLFQARENEWRSVIVVVNHVRGSGAMYGFGAIGNAAGEVVKAIQNGDKKCGELLDAYAETVAGTTL